MSNDNKTLADVQPGGRVRLGDQPWPEIDAILADAYSAGATGLPFEGIARRHAVRAAVAALSAQPSPGGQDALAALQQDYDKLLDSFNRQVEVAEKIAGRALQQDDRIEELEEALAARQPVGQITDAEIDARLNALYREMVDSGQHNGGMSGVAWDRAVFRMASKQPAQAVDLGTGIKAIASERERQLCIEGFSRDSDEQYREGELARAATAYVQLAAMDLQVGSRKHIASQEPPFFWPWAQEWWKPVDARRDLVRAGALIAAQIDLIDSQAVGNG